MLPIVHGREPKFVSPPKIPYILGVNITYIGIDPGVTGAVSFLRRTSNEKQTSASVRDLPVTVHTYLTNQSKSLDIPVLANILDVHINYDVDYVILATEQMQGMGFKTPAKTLTMLAEMAGALEATVRMFCRKEDTPLFIRKYQPKIWTHWMFPGSDIRSKNKTAAKTDSLEKARELFPNLQEELSLKKHHDRAEALLLAFTALAELQGCVIDPKLSKLCDLSNIYLIHSQDAGYHRIPSQPAKFTDVYQSDPCKNDTLAKEILLRKK
jgi:hypothetical protein